MNSVTGSACRAKCSNILQDTRVFAGSAISKGDRNLKLLFRVFNINLGHIGEYIVSM